MHSLLFVMPGVDSVTIVGGTPMQCGQMHVQTHGALL